MNLTPSISAPLFQLRSLRQGVCSYLLSTRKLLSHLGKSGVKCNRSAGHQSPKGQAYIWPSKISKGLLSIFLKTSRRISSIFWERTLASLDLSHNTFPLNTFLQSLHLSLYIYLHSLLILIRIVYHLSLYIYLHSLLILIRIVYHLYIYIYEVHITPFHLINFCSRYTLSLYIYLHSLLILIRIVYHLIHCATDVANFFFTDVLSMLLTSNNSLPGLIPLSTTCYCKEILL